MHIFTRYFVLSTDNKKNSIYFGECERHEFLNVLHSHKTKLKIFVPWYILKQSTCPGMKVSACFVISSGFFLCVVKSWLFQHRSDNGSLQINGTMPW